MFNGVFPCKQSILEGFPSIFGLTPKWKNTSHSIDDSETAGSFQKRNDARRSRDTMNSVGDTKMQRRDEGTLEVGISKSFHWKSNYFHHFFMGW